MALIKHSTPHSTLYSEGVEFSSLLQPPWRDAKLETIFLINKVQFRSILRDVAEFIPTITFCLKCGNIEDFRTKFWKGTHRTNKALILKRSHFQKIDINKLNSDGREKEVEEPEDILKRTIAELKHDLPRLHSYLLFLMQRWMTQDVVSFEATLAMLPRREKICLKCKSFEVLFDGSN